MCRLPGAGRVIDGVIRKEKLFIEAPVNGCRNYNGPNVAKFLVGEVPTCTNGVMMDRLSPPETQ